MRTGTTIDRAGCEELANGIAGKNQAIQPFAQADKRCYNEGSASPSIAATVKTVAELKALPVWVNPDHMISSAKILMAGHGLKALGVVELNRLVGVVTPEQLAGVPGEAKVSSVMSSLEHTIQSNMSVRQLAEMMADHDLQFVPVLKGESFLGIISATMLLKEMERAWDPLTGLCWSDLLREWGIERLMEGREVTIVFVDLDQFRNYNKLYGHAVGDLVLQKVATALKHCVDEGTDVLVRYGGDEFAIGTIRAREDVEELAAEVEARLTGTLVQGAEEPVSASVGVFGGRRTKERENVHFAATLDNLINLASKACLAKKEAEKSAVPKQIEEPAPTASEHSGPTPGPITTGMSVVEVYADDRSPTSLTTVILSKGESVVSAVHTRAGMPVVESVVRATAKAIERALPGAQVLIADVRLTEQPPGSKAIVVAGRLIEGGREQAIGAVHAVGRDVYRSAAEAVVLAVETGIAELG